MQTTELELESLALRGFFMALVVVLISVIGAFYYFRLIKLMYFDEAEEGELKGAAPSMLFDIYRIIAGIQATFAIEYLYSCLNAEQVVGAT